MQIDDTPETTVPREAYYPIKDIAEETGDGPVPTIRIPVELADGRRSRLSTHRAAVKPAAAHPDTMAEAEQDRRTSFEAVHDDPTCLMASQPMIRCINRPDTGTASCPRTGRGTR